MSEKILTLRVPTELKNEFDKVAKEKDITTSQMIRAYMRYEVEQLQRRQEKTKGKK